MEMYNGNGTNNKLQIKETHEEVTEYVVRKYKNLDIPPVRANRKKLELREEVKAYDISRIQ
jgi:hypothetical protein